MLGGTLALFILAALLTMVTASATRPWERSQRGDSGICLPPPMRIILQRQHSSYGTHSLCHIMRGGEESFTQRLEDVDIEVRELKVFTTTGPCRAGWVGRWQAADFSSLAGSRLLAAAACSQRRNSGRHPETRRSLGLCWSRSRHLVFKWRDKKIIIRQMDSEGRTIVCTGGVHIYPGWNPTHSWRPGLLRWWKREQRRQSRMGWRSGPGQRGLAVPWLQTGQASVQTCKSKVQGQIWGGVHLQVT